MKPEDHFLFMASRQKLEPEHVRHMQAAAAHPRFNWEWVFSTAEHSGIMPLIYSHIMELPELADRVPQELKDRGKLCTVRNIFLKKERAQLLSQALRFFHERNIEVIVFKGAAQELMVYNEPWMTVSSDVDLILNVHRESLNEKQLREISKQFHQTHVEFDYFSHHDFNMNNLLPVDFTAVWQSARPFDYFGQPCLVLSPEDHLLSLCINSCRKRYFRLKSLFDINESILKCQEIDWVLFAERARRFECENIAYTALYVASLTLETSIPESVMCQLNVLPVRAGLIRMITWLLVRLWSISSTQSSSFFRCFGLSLILPYVSYNLRQTLKKPRLIHERRSKLR